MRICTVCGQKANNWKHEITRGMSKEWVCRNCLKKAHISVTKFRLLSITSGQIMSIISAKEIAGQLPTENGAVVGMHCPRCKSTDLQIISDVAGRGVSGTKVLFGGLFGLSGAGRTQTTHYWICKKCGNRFKV